MKSRLKYLERGIKKLPISKTGYHFERKIFLKRGIILEAWTAHTHPKLTQVPPPPGKQTRQCRGFMSHAIFVKCKLHPRNARL